MRKLRPEQVWLRKMVYGRPGPIPALTADRRCTLAVLDFAGEAVRACTFLRHKLRRTPRYVDDAFRRAGYGEPWSLNAALAECVDAAEALRLVCHQSRGAANPWPVEMRVKGVLADFGYVAEMRSWAERAGARAAFLDYALGKRTMAQRVVP